MSLTAKEKARRDYLVSGGERGATNPELHRLNILNNIDRESGQLWNSVATRPDRAPQAQAELRRRGEL